MRILICLCLSFLAVSVSAQELCPIIPVPLSHHKLSGEFGLSNKTTIVIKDNSLKPLARYLQKEALKTLDASLVIGTSSSSAIELVLNKVKAPKKEAYALSIKPGKVMISADDPNGIFYGITSLMQIANQSKNSKGVRFLPSWDILDEPKYGWRGMMMDESRHFEGIEKVKSMLDWMAFYKLNRFHWHLTDEPGWRIEIKKYPRLALVGGIGDFFNDTKPAQYYTQEQIKEIVAYAAERYIEVIPEIDMPGHATAANKAYPQYSGGGSPGHPDFTFHPGKNSTYHFLTDILREVNVLFPSGLIHLGGDEVSFGNQKWATDTAVVQLMKDNKLANVKEVETYFMKRMADSLSTLNAKLLAWDEMADVGLNKDQALIFWWRQDKPEQLQKAISNGYKVVLTPRLPFYFDFVQDSTHTYGRKWGKLYNSIKDVYSYTAPVGNADAAKPLVLGMQANLWAETVQSTQRFDYLMFPRIAALAESAWSSDETKDFPQFMERLKLQLPLYRRAGLYYYNPFKPLENPEPVKVGVQRKLFNTEE